MISRRLLVTGRVQGVFYRDSCRQEAERLGVSGWVRNLPDGSVEAVFEGDAHAVEELISWAHRGPPQAQVRSVQVSAEPVDDHTGFRVR